MAVDSSYLIEPGTSPDAIKRRRQIAEALMLRGTDTSPIASPWQGAARMAQALMGGIELGMYDKQDREGRAQAAKDFEAGMGGGASPVSNVTTALADVPKTPSFVASGGKMAQAPEDLQPFFDEASKATGIPAPVLMAKVRQESNFNPNAVGGAGEIGLAQILPSTAKSPGFGLMGIQPDALRDPRTNIMFGAQYLAARGKAAGVNDWTDPNQVAKALTAYNGGGDPNYAQNVMRFLPKGPLSPVTAALAGSSGQPTMQGGSDTLQPPRAPAAAPVADTSGQQQAIMRALQNPYLNAGQKQVLMLRYQSLQKDPTVELQRQQLQFNIDEAKRKAAREAQRDPLELQKLQREATEPKAPPVIEIDNADGSKTKMMWNGTKLVPIPTEGLPPPTPIPPDAVPPPGVDPKEWKKQYTQSQAPGSFEDASKLRTEIQQLPAYKNFSQAAPIYRSMVKAADTNSKAADLNLVYGLGKIMDPTSVVREGEMVMVKNTAGLPEWFQGVVNGLNGGQALTPETRKAIMQEAYNRLTAYQEQFAQDTLIHKTVATKKRISPEDVIPNFGEFNPWAPAAPKAASAPPVVAPNVDPRAIEEAKRRGLIK